MSNNLSNIFKRFVPNRTWKKYSIYALGEIALLVVGILVALQINNWNENRKSSNQLVQIIKTVKIDLIQDTTSVNRMISLYEIQDTLCDKFINKTVTSDYFNSCLYCTGLGGTYLPFHPNKKGYSLLEKFVINSDSQDSLVDFIVKFYNQTLNIFSSSNEMLKLNVLKNIETFYEKDWYVDWTQHKRTKDMADYYCNSEEFRKMMATYKLYAISNHLNLLKMYKKSTIIGLKQIDEFLINK